jgi:hypothetical protein
MADPAAMSEADLHVQRARVATEAARPSVPATCPASRWVWIAAIVALTLAYFAWTTASSFDEPLRIRPAGHPETDHFNLLSHGFLKGHLHLDGEVPAALLEAPNPYDPATRPHVPVLHDASLYRGKYYIYCSCPSRC